MRAREIGECRFCKYYQREPDKSWGMCGLEWEVRRDDDWSASFKPKEECRKEYLIWLEGLIKDLISWKEVV
jgi:hypothetical protein